LDDHNENIYDYSFNILWSESGTGPYEDYSGPIVNVFRYYFRGNIRSKARLFFFKIQIKHVPSGTITETEPFTSYEAYDKRHLEMIRQNHIRLVVSQKGVRIGGRKA